VLRMSATARSTWSRAPEMVMVRSGSLGVSSDRDCTLIVEPESLMKSRTVWPLWPISRPHRRRDRASLTWAPACRQGHGGERPCQPGAPEAGQAEPLSLRHSLPPLGSVQPLGAFTQPYLVLASPAAPRALGAIGCGAGAVARDLLQDQEDGGQHRVQAAREQQHTVGRACNAACAARRVKTYCVAMSEWK
jgi:hypothetical protein